MGMPKTTPESFWARVEARGPDECWPWTGRTTPRGYGELCVDYKTTRAHRHAYTLKIGPIPEDLVLDHMCHDPEVCYGGACEHRRCCNPAHMEPKTIAENVSADRTSRRMRVKDACKYGHPWDEYTTTYSKSGTRVCRQCNKEKMRRSRERRVAQHYREESGECQ